MKTWKQYINEENSILDDVMNLTPQIMSSLTSRNRYSDFELIHRDFIEFVKNNENKYKIWQDAWKDFYK